MAKKSDVHSTLPNSIEDEGLSGMQATKLTDLYPADS